MVLKAIHENVRIENLIKHTGVLLTYLALAGFPPARLCRNCFLSFRASEARPGIQYS